MTALLDGMRVLDAGIWRPVPHATQMLADLGAQVLKIEPPGGDPMRTFPNLFRDVAGHKRSIELNLRSDEGKARALELVADADVFCEGWRPGVAARLGLSYDDVRARNPSIIYCSVSGYGQTGPNVERPGHDVNYQALAGALAPRAGEEPAIPRVPIADLAAGTIAAFCICAAWAKRIQTGEGERIDVAMADVVASWSGTSSGNVLRGRTQPTRGSGRLRRVPLRRRRLDHVGGHLRGPLLAGRVRRARAAGRAARARPSRTARPVRRMPGGGGAGVRPADARRGARPLTRAGAPVAPVLDPAEMAANEQFRVREVVFDAGDGTARLGFPARLQAPSAARPARPDVDRDGPWGPTPAPPSARAHPKARGRRQGGRGPNPEAGGAKQFGNHDPAAETRTSNTASTWGKRGPLEKGGEPNEGGDEEAGREKPGHTGTGGEEKGRRGGGGGAAARGGWIDEGGDQQHARHDEREGRDRDDDERAARKARGTEEHRACGHDADERHDARSRQHDDDGDGRERAFRVRLSRGSAGRPDCADRRREGQIDDRTGECQLGPGSGGSGVRSRSNHTYV